MLAKRKFLLRGDRTFGRLVVLSAAAAVPRLTAGGFGGPPSLTRVASSSTTVTINAAKQYQRIAGFGVSEGFGQAKTLMNAPASIQKQVLSLLYSPTHGAGLTILRNEISADAGFTIEPKAPSSPNAKPSYLTLAAVDQDQGQLWFAKQIKADYRRDRRVRRCLERSRVHEDQRLGNPRRHGVRGPGRASARAVIGARLTPTTSCSTRRITPRRAYRSPT